MRITGKEEMKKVIYTCIVGDYDELHQPTVVDDSFDFICFSNDIKEEQQGVWRIRPIPFHCEDKTRLSRYVKILPHKALPDYDWSLWIDANIGIIGKELYASVNAMIDSGSQIAQVPHLERDCVYEEIAKCYADERISLKDALKQKRHLHSEGFPRGFGMMENNLILRKHNDPDMIRISDGWWKEYSSYSIRDQLSLMPVYWKEGLYPALLLGEGKSTRNVSFFQRFKHPGAINIKSIKGFSRFIKKVEWNIKIMIAGVFLK